MGIHLLAKELDGAAVPEIDGIGDDLREEGSRGIVVE